MQPAEFRAARLLAGLQTQQATADALETTLRTVQRWEAGAAPVPGPARVALRCIARLRGFGIQNGVAD